MEHNFMNPLEEITFLIDKINIHSQTYPNKMSVETLDDSPEEEENITELMEQVTLEDHIEEEI